MKIQIFGFTITNEKNNLSSLGAIAKRNKTEETLLKAIDHIKTNNLTFSEYRLKKVSGLSINTIKKYRDFIELHS